MSRISNCQFSVNDPAWIQCSLPVRLGGLGIRSGLHLPPVAYLASSAASVDLVRLILPSFLSFYIILRALKSANLPARLEPTSLGNCDNKRPDGVTLVPWSAGRYLVWDFTCVDTYAPSYIPKTSLEVGAAATMAEDRKRSKYSYLGQGYSFSPVAIETSGVFGRSTTLFLKDLGRRLRESTHDMFSYCFLIGRLSIELQRSNCISILGTLPT